VTKIHIRTVQLEQFAGIVGVYDHHEYSEGRREPLDHWAARVDDVAG
jgi:hypothetical protein